MILYFSATGNSKLVGELIGKAINQEPVDLLKKIQEKDYSEINSDTNYVICCPTYAYKIPRILTDWLLKTPLSGNKNIYFILTCGSSVSGAGEYAKKLAKEKGMNYKGLAKVVMPENYIAMFKAPEEDEAKRIIKSSLAKISSLASLINENKEFEDNYNKLDILFSQIVNEAFFKLYIRDSAFKVSDKCISCGKCVKNCPTNNLKLERGKPVWLGNCTHCMSCICGCPTEAIEYGFISKGKVRYNCPGNIE